MSCFFARLHQFLSRLFAFVFFRRKFAVKNLAIRRKMVIFAENLHIMNVLDRKIYIWQLPQWPDFTWDAEALLPALERLNRLHGLLAGRMSMLGFSHRSQSLLSAMTEELIASSEIEGVMLNPQSVRSSIARKLGIDDDGIVVEDHYVEGLVGVMLDAVRNCHEPMSADRLFDWHAALFPMGRSGMTRITVADWRQGEEPMQVVSGPMGHEKVHYQAPPSSAVPEAMEQLISRINSAEYSPFLMAAIAHLWFVTIHPFDDGNGRISRTLSDMFLARLDEGSGHYYSMSAEINRNKKAYYEMLEKTQKQTNLDITEWIQWFLGCVGAALERAITTVDSSLRKAAYWDKFRLTEVNERQRKVINRLWDGFEGKLTTSKWAKICHCSQDTALRDITDLVNKQMLVRGPESGRQTNYLLPKING